MALDWHVSADPMTHVRDGDLHVRAGATQAAIASYERAARGFEQRRQLLKAHAMYRQILKLDPDSASAKRRAEELIIAIRQPP